MSYNTAKIAAVEWLILDLLGSMPKYINFSDIVLQIIKVQYNSTSIHFGIFIGDAILKYREHNTIIETEIDLTYWKSDSLWYWDLYQTHLKYKQAQQVKLKQVFWSIYSVKCVFQNKLVIPNITHNWSLGEIYFHWFIFFLSIFMSLLMALNSKKYK